MRTLLLPLLVLAACSQKGTVSLDDTGDKTGADDSATDDSATDDSAADDSAADDSDDGTPDCAATIEVLDPGDGAADMSIQPNLTASLSEPVEEGDARATLTGPDGEVPGAVTLERDGARVRFTPDEALARDSEYTITFEVCQDSASADFLTVGAPIGDTVAGNVYDVDLTQVAWNQPPNGSLLAGFLTSAHLLFLVESVDVDADTIVFVGALGAEDSGLEQDICTEPFPFDPADYSSDPAFQVGPTSTVFEASGYALQVFDLSASGAFSGDAELLRNMRVSAYLQVGDLQTDFGNACDFAPTFLGASCVTCPDGSEGCLELDVVAAQAPRVDVDVDPNNVPADHAECQ